MTVKYRRYYQLPNTIHSEYDQLSPYKMVKNVDHMRSFLALLVLVKFYGESIASVYPINLNRCNNECCFVPLHICQ